MKNSIIRLPIQVLIMANLLPVQVSTAALKQSSKPNILFILTDDQRADAIGASGNTYIRTPNIDRIAKNGCRFTNGYVMGGQNAAICGPSRAMLLSGKSLFHVYDRLDGVTTMPEYFGEYGYETFGTGKWHNRLRSFEASFQKAKNAFIGGMCDPFKVPCQDMGKDGKLGNIVLKGYSTDVFASAAIDYLNEYANGDMKQPFFCYVAFTAPHDPRSPHPDYVGMYPDESIPVPGNFKKLHPFAFDQMDVRDECLASWPRIPETIQASLADYYAMITHLDTKIGEIISTLKENKLYDNTIIVFASDNGLAIGSHGLLGKQNSYEHSTKVPIIISGPGIPKNEVSEAFIYLFDLYPTLCNLSHIPLPKDIDGKDLTPVLKGDKEGVRDVMYNVYRNTVRSVRTKEWKLIRYPQRNYNQLFNLVNDPLEIYNLAYFEKFQTKVQEMKALLKACYIETNDTATMNPPNILPLKYDYTKFEQIPDQHQNEYTLKKYFKGVKVNEVLNH